MEKISKKKYGGKDPRMENQRKGGLTTMARGQNNGITILLGVKDLKIGEVIEYEDKIVVKASINKREEKCPYCVFRLIRTLNRKHPDTLSTDLILF